MKISTPTVLERQTAFANLVDEESKLLLAKGHDYTAGKADSDAYANFRLIAELLEGVPITPYSVAMIYALKHVFSLLTFAKSGKQESGEGLRGRHMDVRNYMFILNELVPDHLNHFSRKEVLKKEEEEEEVSPMYYVNAQLRELDELASRKLLEGSNFLFFQTGAAGETGDTQPQVTKQQ
jgi:hypothetical protein